MRNIFYLIFVISLTIFSCTETKNNNLSEAKKILTTAAIESVKLQETIEVLKNELQTNPESKLAAQLLATAYSRKSHTDSAVIVLTKSIGKYKKGLAEFYQGRSMNYFILKNIEMATEDIQKAIQYDPVNPRLYRQLVFLAINKNYNSSSGWLEFTEKDIENIIDDVYPDGMEKPTVAEFNDVTKK